jgi:acyl carrier protein
VRGEAYSSLLGVAGDAAGSSVCVSIARELPARRVMNPIQSTVKEYILEQFLPGVKPTELEPTTPLISGGILDSLATIRLVAFLEEQYGITVEPHETGVDFMDTLELISQLVERKHSPKS